MSELLPMAAWRHQDSRVGFEVVFLRHEHDLYHLDGYSTAVQEGQGWGIRYAVTVDEGWATRSANVVAQSAFGVHGVRLERDASGGWLVDGVSAPYLEGCLDVDLEASACTNALPVHRLGLGVGQEAEAPASYVRAPVPRVERLEQSYARLDDDEARNARYAYVAPAFDFKTVLVFDRFGLLLEYPGIAVRAA